MKRISNERASVLRRYCFGFSGAEQHELIFSRFEKTMQKKCMKNRGKEGR